MSRNEGSTGEPWWNDSETDPIHLEAAAWFVRLTSPQVSRNETAEFLEWSDKDHRHREAFVRLVETSYIVSRTSVRRERDIRKLTQDRYDGEHALGTRRARPYISRARYAIAASVAIVIGFGATLLHMGFPGGAREPIAQKETSFETQIGENKTVVLADGSRVTLGGDTRVGVMLTDKERAVRLYTGEAYFEVAKEPMRNFIVLSGSITVTAVGTEFNVNHVDEKSVVTVAEGGVLVEPLAQIKTNLQPRSVRLNAGEQSTTDQAGSIGDPVAVRDLASILSWQSGRLSFRQLPLRDAVRDVNRYTQKPLVLATSSIGNIEVTGTVSPSNTGGWIRSLERAFGLKAIEEPDRISIYSAHEQNQPEHPSH